MMNKITAIIEFLEFESIDESIEEIKSKMGFYSWLKKEYEELNDQLKSEQASKYIDRYIASLTKRIDELAAKIVNLSKDSKKNIYVELFTRGQDIKTSIGIGYGDGVSSFMSYANKIISNVHGFVDEYGGSKYVDYYVKRALAVQGMIDILRFANTKSTYKPFDDEWILSKGFGDLSFDFIKAGNFPS